MKFAGFPVWKLESTIEKIAPTDFNVLITGERGTLKETIARRIFETSARRSGPYHHLDARLCRLDEILAGNSAVAGGSGEDSRATIFVEGVSELDPDDQRLLLQLAASRESEGRDHRSRRDFRIIASSHVDLMERALRGDFRKDLYFRLCEVQIRTAPLRNHRVEIPEVFNVLLSARTGKKPAIQISPEQCQLIQNYRWPGNLRQLAAFADQVARLPDPSAAFEDLQRRLQKPPTAFRPD